MRESNDHYATLQLHVSRTFLSIYLFFLLSTNIYILSLAERNQQIYLVCATVRRIKVVTDDIY